MLACVSESWVRTVGCSVALVLCPSNTVSFDPDPVNECSALGVPFVPACLSQKKRTGKSDSKEHSHNQKSFWKPDEGDDGSESDNSEDSMSDLYPAKLFNRNDDKGAELLLKKEDNPSEKMEVETLRKRKKTEPHPFTKKKLKEWALQRPNNRGMSQKVGDRS
ncbi:hypothetical protein scyTo_0021618 [Scyliorhinus torazame]|uniref:Uncharacterized protein n=1 Tax=Scyliorhinus torazame TaxID=75743 RepID=A0A401QAS1_SCYTO|nr:hypothetical protein [Scyliorhinus torazame]